MKSIESQLFIGIAFVIGLFCIMDFDFCSLAAFGSVVFWAYTVLYPSRHAPNNGKRPPYRCRY